MRTVYTYYSEEEYGEVQAFFDEKFKIITAWSCDDANYRSEYMDPLFEAVGVKMVHLPANKFEMADKAIKKEFGF